MRRVLVVTVLPWLFLCALAAPALGGETPSPPPVCAAAQALVDAGHPQRAVTLLDRAAGRPRCSATMDAARLAERDARTLLRYADSLARRAAADPALWPDVLALVDDIVKVDADVTVGDRTLDDLRDDADESRDFLSQDDVEASSDGWAGLADGYLRQLGSILAAAAGTALLLLALARLAITFPWFNEWWRSSKVSRGVAQWVGVTSLVAASLHVALRWPDAVGARTVDWWPPILVGLGLALVAVAALTYVLSTRLRVSISVAGETEKAGTTEIVALLRELGASAPQGLEVPRGADLTVLEGKNILTGSTGWLAPVINAVQQLLGFTPWKVVVDNKGENADETFVVVTRNGRSVDAATIRRQPWGATGPTVDTAKVAAAFVLKALADGYAASDFRGLAGAREWASIGLQYVATTDGSLDRSHRKELLTYAVDLDPSNLLAQVSLKHEQYRHVTSHEELHTYLDWLRTFVGGDPLAHQGSLLEQYPDLDLRVRYTALAVALNHLSVLDDGCDAAEARRDLSHWGLSVLARLHKPLPADEQPRPELRLPAGWDRSGPPAVKKLRRRVEIASAPMLAQIGIWTPAQVAARREDSPTAEYNTICWEVTDGRASPHHVTRLKRILASPEEIEWARHDPTLQPLHRFDEWREEYGAKLRSFLEVEPFVAHAEGLTRLGLGSVETLARSPLPSYDAAFALATTPATYDRLRAAAALIDDIDLSKLARHRVEIFAVLWAMGLGSIDALERTTLTCTAVVDRIWEALDDLPTTRPDRDALVAWVAGHRPQ